MLGMSCVLVSGCHLGSTPCFALPVCILAAHGHTLMPDLKYKLSAIMSTPIESTTSGPLFSVTTLYFQFGKLKFNANRFHLGRAKLPTNIGEHVIYGNTLMAS
jgi:hypothetical protein